MRAAFALIAGSQGRIGSTVYGTLAVLTALIAAYAAEKHHPWSLVEVVLTAAFVFWVAYIYAHALSESIEEGTRLDRQILSGVASRELGLVYSVMAPVLVLVLGAVGVTSESTAVWLAIAAGIGVLSTEGIRYAHATQLGRVGTAAVLIMNILLGVCVVALKVTLVH